MWPLAIATTVSGVVGWFAGKKAVNEQPASTVPLDQQGNNDTTKKVLTYVALGVVAYVAYKKLIK